MQKEFDTAESLLSKFMGQKDVETGAKEVHQFYGYKIGKIKEQNKIKKYQITDPNSQQLLKDADFYIKNAAACFQEKSLQIFFQKTYSTQKLIHSITNFTKDGSKHISEYITKANYNVKKFKEAYNVDENYAYGCCLALSYYTGSQSQRVSRSCNIVIKLYVKGNVKQLQNSPQYQATRCIGQWLFRALNCISLYWGQVTRCINLAQEEYQLYSPGNIVTWLQFSSSSYSQPTAYFATRNTRFVIYSLSGRCIQTFSNYGATESQVLFKPFSHFLVIKKQLADGKQYIYMRQIFIGQTKKNVLWVDDNIFRADWENKKIMERALVKQPLLNIIPKVSTQCALAFLESGLGRNRNSSQFRIITDMTRVNQKPSHNAGARFVKACLDLKVNHQILVFTSDKAKAEEHLKKLNVDSKGVKITVVTEDALKYLCFG